jgi:hypothetical protein
MKIKKLSTLFGMLFVVLILVNAFAFDSQEGTECET